MLDTITRTETVLPLIGPRRQEKKLLTKIHDFVRKERGDYTCGYRHKRKVQIMKMENFFIHLISIGVVFTTLKGP